MRDRGGGLLIISAPLETEVEEVSKDFVILWSMFSLSLSKLRDGELKMALIRVLL